LKLLLDEMYPSLIARELGARGHDGVSVHESPGSGTPDERVLDHARSEGRAIVTENVRDYRPLADALLAAARLTPVSSSRPTSAGHARAGAL
jgi:predicted nuclease of predicted toxin-antitoxin system